MGLEIKKNKQGLYKLKSSVSDENLNDGWITEDEVKKILIEREFGRFMQNVIEIDMEFPSGYYINDKRKFINNKHASGGRFLLDHWYDEEYYKKYNEIIDRLKIEL
ncbi:hypothetical protein M0Q97_11490 [Candidatus Dojkabacteria bacterium]|jgi:hypothetical protein|nr:hypothetical protein [Candidatus Dojkabacteria bacterium]